ncbi:MAG: adenylate/guanylate cyclase domain-containing protein, partial [Bacteroidota bacterium]
LDSLIKSSRSISSEIVLEKLLPAMIYIAVENAGAQSGYLLLEKQGKLFLSAYSEIEQEQGNLLSSLPLQDSYAVPKSIINYVFRTQTPLVIDYVGNEDRFSQDPYFEDKDAKSILCYPLLHSGEIKGIIYLENNLIVSAFGEKQTKVLNILSAQTAVSLQNAMLYNDLEKSLDKQIRLTEAYSRFTPDEYLSFLGHESILDAQLGDHKHAEMVVLFCDIRSYTTISEQMTPEDNFAFMSNYHHRMSGFIAKNNGIINQLLGDGIMAFFFSPEDAVDASIDIQLELLEYNRERQEKGRSPVKVGVGLHKGPVIIGIVGNEKRMGITISSDTVNTASRVEGLTKYYGSNILLSKTVAKELGAIQMKKIRRLGEVKVKGKSKTLDLLECFAGDPPAIHAKKSSHFELFKVGQNHYFNQEFEKALEVFQHICKGNPDDGPAHWYLERAEHYHKNGVPENWAGVEEMGTK